MYFATIKLQYNFEGMKADWRYCSRFFSLQSGDLYYA